MCLVGSYVWLVASPVQFAEGFAIDPGEAVPVKMVAATNLAGFVASPGEVAENPEAAKSPEGVGSESLGSAVQELVGHLGLACRTLAQTETSSQSVWARLQRSSAPLEGNSMSLAVLGVGYLEGHFVNSKGCLEVGFGSCLAVCFWGNLGCPEEGNLDWVRFEDSPGGHFLGKVACLGERCGGSLDYLEVCCLEAGYFLGTLDPEEDILDCFANSWGCYLEEHFWGLEDSSGNYPVAHFWGQSLGSPRYLVAAGTVEGILLDLGCLAEGIALVCLVFEWGNLCAYLVGLVWDILADRLASLVSGRLGEHPASGSRVGLLAGCLFGPWDNLALAPAYSLGERLDLGCFVVGF